MNQAPGKVLPWHLVALICGTLGLAVLAVLWMFGPAAVPGALAGVIIGVFGSLMGSRRLAAGAAVAVGVATYVDFASPSWVTLVLVVPAMSALVGWEAGKIGSRCFVFALFAWIMLDARAQPQGDGSLALGFLLSAIFGISVVVLSGKESIRPPTPGGDFYGLAVFISLWLGLVVIMLVSTLFPSAYAYWMALMFAMRFFAAPGLHVDGALRFAVGTVLGATLAGAALGLPLPELSFQLVGVGCMLMGLRLLPAGTPLTAMLISAGVIFVITPTIDSAVFRLEAAVIATSLAVALNWVMDRVEEILSGKPVS
jgi:hypothetical protein